MRQRNPDLGKCPICEAEIIVSSYAKDTTIGCPEQDQHDIWFSRHGPNHRRRALAAWRRVQKRIGGRR